MSVLAEEFPCLEGKPGVRPWQADRLDGWAAENATGAEQAAARFVLRVWNSRIPWLSGRFDLLEALGHWDEADRAAYARWAADPWWL